MKNKQLQLTLMIVLGVVIIGLIVLLILGSIGSGKVSSKVEADATQVKDVSKVNDYGLKDYYSNGSEQTKVDSSNTQAQTPVATGDYIIEKSGTTPLTDADLAGLNAQQLTYARNEIYARHGRPFQSVELQEYFKSKPWYQENPGYQDSQVSPLEEANAEFIAGFQTRSGQEYNPR